MIEKRQAVIMYISGGIAYTPSGNKIGELRIPLADIEPLRGQLCDISLEGGLIVRVEKAK